MAGTLSKDVKERMDRHYLTLIYLTICILLGGVVVGMFPWNIRPESNCETHQETNSLKIRVADHTLYLVNHSFTVHVRGTFQNEMRFVSPCRWDVKRPIVYDYWYIPQKPIHYAYFFPCNYSKTWQDDGIIPRLPIEWRPRISKSFVSHDNASCILHIGVDGQLTTHPQTCHVVTVDDDYYIGPDSNSTRTVTINVD